ncbi:MAG: hypothetical protein IPM22_04200 [Betaproteobacteria bacterium]|nr:hypothetical protein [Betaproteobacteria bacterium]
MTPARASAGMRRSSASNSARVTLAALLEMSTVSPAAVGAQTAPALAMHAVKASHARRGRRKDRMFIEGTGGRDGDRETGRMRKKKGRGSLLAPSAA